MCGICGIYHTLSNEPIDPGLLTRMTRVLAHRGPDGEGFYVDGPVGLGHRRLSIIDVEGGAQPLSNEDGTVWITFNGEIYNFKELARELQSLGHRFRSRSDTEVLVHGYEEWGDDVVLRLNGMFAFGLWDARKRRMLLARDHFGVKPLYYFHDGQRLIFASELKAILQHPACEPQIDPEGLNQALAFGFVPSPYSLFQGIRKLEPGYRLCANEADVRVERYWHPVPVPLIADEGELVHEIRERLARSVERQMVSDVPIGALLSGGVDSTAVVTLMGRHSENVRTFSIGVRDEADINELTAARETARRLGTDHQELEIGAQEYMDFLERAHWHLEEPCTPSALLTYFVCKLAGQSVKVVLTGQGADEIFSGYARYVGESYSGLYQRLPGVFTQRLLPALLSGVPGRLRWKRAIYALGETDDVQRFTRIYEVFHPAERRAILHPDVAAHLDESGEEFNPISRWSEGLDEMASLDRLLYIDARCSLSDNLLMFGDKMAMAASVEARVPMLDLELAEFVERIPARLRMKHRVPKSLLKQALSEWVPSEVLKRPKLGFQIPEAKWFRGSMLDYLEDLLLSENSLSATYLNRQAVSRTIQIHRSGRQNLWRQIFSLLSIELLYRSFLKPGAEG